MSEYLTWLAQAGPVESTQGVACIDITLHAHFDGERILLDEPFELEPDTKRMVTVLLKGQPNAEREAWLNLSGRRLEDAYGDDEVEYSLNSIKEANPEYEKTGVTH